MKILQHSSTEGQEAISYLANRRLRIFDHYKTEAMNQIQNFRSQGDAALVMSARENDGVELNDKSLWVDPALIKSAHKGLQAPLRQAIEHAKDRIERFQADLKTSSVQAQEESGVLWGTILRSLDSIGIYVPGGRANYVMSLLLAAVPARMSGVSEIIVATPPKRKIGTPWVDPLFLYAAKILEISKVLVAGGPAALAALAFGTKASAPVQKIFASGGARTIVALHQLSGYVGVESCAAHCELAIVADRNTSIEAVAADILGWADRDPEALVVVLQDDEKWIRNLTEKLAVLINEVKDSASRETIQACLEKNFFCFVTKSLSDSLTVSNRLALGTLSLQVEGASDYLDQIESAGQVLVGPFSLPSATDIIGGAAGLVPTLGSATYSTNLSPSSFLRRFPYVDVSQEALERTHLESEKLALEEGFHTRTLAFEARSKEFK